MGSKLHAHFRAMQNMAAQYLEPGPYTDRDGKRHVTNQRAQEAFISDMIYMLDGPEQRDAEEQEAK